MKNNNNNNNNNNNKKKENKTQYIEDAFPRAKRGGEKFPHVWRIRVSIPAPPACEAGALPFELIPQHTSVLDLRSTEAFANLLKLIM